MKVRVGVEIEQRRFIIKDHKVSYKLVQDVVAPPQSQRMILKKSPQKARKEESNPVKVYYSTTSSPPWKVVVQVQVTQWEIVAFLKMNILRNNKLC